MINFMGKKWLYFLISAFFLLPGIVSLTMWGLKPSIDFTGGTFWELRFPENVDARKGEVIEIVQAQGVEVQVFQSSSSQVYRLRTKFMTSDTAQTILPKLKEKFGDVQEVRFGTVGPTLGAEFLRKTIIAVILAIFIILGYVAWTFKNVEYGVSAILALLHDTIILIGIFSLLGHFFQVEVDALFVTAVLTIMSFSVHDTIVVYDRIRESKRHYPDASMTDLINKAVNETLGRSVNNSMTIIIMLTALLLLGGETIKWFAFALLVGTISGTFSSTFTAAPILDLWHTLDEKRKKGKK
ncbi:MAG TPA: protein translocase subunit SecF [Patescibacteria group bacterium]|nr:protein translocase subunit SecF [Patescibacteria group bacterium]